MSEQSKRDAIDQTAQKIVKETERNGQRITHEQARDRVRRAILKTENRKARR